MHDLPRANAATSETPTDDPESLDDLLQELRILLQGPQVLTAFLVILPFSGGFAKIQQSEKWVYLATFAGAITSLIFFSAPAIQHRLERPLRDRVRFKLRATRLIIAGTIAFSVALVLATHLVVAEVIGRPAAAIMAVFAAVLIGGLWWVLPLAWKHAIDRGEANR